MAYTADGQHLNEQQRGTKALGLAQLIAPHMTGAWRAEQHPQYLHQVQLVGPANEVLWTSVDSYGKAGRLEVRGKLPGEYSDWYKVDNPEITVAETKDPKVIARDIERRLLPTYRVALAEVTARVDRRTKAATSKAEVIARLLARYPNMYHQTHSDRIYGDGVAIKLNSDGTEAYEFEIRGVPVAEVFTLLAAYFELRSTRKSSDL